MWRNEAPSLNMNKQVLYIRIIYRRITIFLREILWNWILYKSKRPSKERKEPPKKRRLGSIIPIII